MTRKEAIIVVLLSMAMVLAFAGLASADLYDLFGWFTDYYRRFI